jgi:hypothetical protein
MGDLEFSLKEVMGELKESVKQLSETMSEIKIMIAEEYVKKSECKECFNGNKEFKSNIINWLIGVYSVVIIGITSIFLFVKK